MIKWEKLPEDHARRCPKKSPWDTVGPFPQEQIRLHHLITAGGKRKDLTVATQIHSEFSEHKPFSLNCDT